MTKLKLFFEEEIYLWREDRVREKLPEVVNHLDLTDALNGLCGVFKQELHDLKDYFANNWFNSKIPLLFYKEEQPTEIAGLIDYLYELIYNSGEAVKNNRAEDIRHFRERLSSLLRDGVSLAGILVKKYTGETIGDREAAELYAALPDLSGATGEEVRRAVLDALSKQAKQKKISELRQCWKTLTGCESPEEWSEKMRTPIQWVLDGEAYHTFMHKYKTLNQLSQTEIEEMIAFLNDHTDDLAILHDRQYILDRFVQAVAGEYAGLVKQAGTAGLLQDYIYRVLNNGVHTWPMRINDVNKLVRQWVSDNYRHTAYPQIVRVIDSMSPDNIKRFIMSLIAEDALVGARLLAVIEEKSYKAERGDKNEILR